MKPDAALVRRAGRRHEALDGVDDGDDLLVLALELALELGELVGELLMSCEESAQPDERANDKDTHFDGAGRIEHGRGHDGAVLSEGIGELAVPAPP